jgi:hypothetical protein
MILRSPLHAPPPLSHMRAGTSYADFIDNMNLPSNLAQVDPIVASFCGGAIGVLSALLVVEINNVKSQHNNRCVRCVHGLNGTGAGKGDNDGSICFSTSGGGGDAWLCVTDLGWRMHKRKRQAWQRPR